MGIVLLALLLTNCTNYFGVHKKQTMISPSAFKTQQSIPQQQGQWPTFKWATELGDTQLVDLINQAMLTNPELKVAEARIRQARAIVESKTSPLFPNASFLGGYSRFQAPKPLSTGNWESVALMGLNGSYELDFWGKNYSALVQSISQEKASEAAFYATHLMLSTTIAAAYNQLEYSYALEEVLIETVAQRKKIDDLVKLRVMSGLDTQVSLEQSINLYARARTQLAAVQGQLKQTKQQLGILVGLGPDAALSLKKPHLKPYPHLKLPDAIPLHLVGRRPDIVAARWQVEAALQGAKNIKARFYPDVNLYAFAGYMSFGASKLVLPANELLAFTPAVNLPIFDANALRAALKGQYGVVDEKIGTYNATLDNALGDVAEQITRAQALRKQLILQKDALLSAQKAYTLARQQYGIGLASHIIMLNAQTRYLEERQSRLELIKERRDSYVGLIKALGGGFDEHMITPSNG